MACSYRLGRWPFHPDIYCCLRDCPSSRCDSRIEYKETDRHAPIYTQAITHKRLPTRRTLLNPTTTSSNLLSRLSQFHRVKLIFMFGAFVSFVLSVTLWFLVDREVGLFVGLWVPAIHSLGVLVLVGEDTTQ